MNPDKKLRTSYGLSPWGFAEILGIHVTTLYRWESRRNAAKGPFYVRLYAEMAKVPPEQRKQIGAEVTPFLIAGRYLYAHAIFTLHVVLAVRKRDGLKGE